MFTTLLSLINQTLFHVSFAYATFITLKTSRNSEPKFKPNTHSSSPSSLSSSELRQSKLPFICIVPSTLKLWLMLGSLAALSLLGADILPLFQEFRVLAMLIIVFSSEIAQVRLYDMVFAPTLIRLSSFWHEPHRKTIIIRHLALLVVRSCIFSAIASMNYIKGNNNICHDNVSNITLSSDLIEDVISGLVFSQRALCGTLEKEEINKKDFTLKEEEREENIKLYKDEMEMEEEKREEKQKWKQNEEPEINISVAEKPVALEDVNCNRISTTECSNVEQKTLPVKLGKPPTFGRRMSEWLSAHANVQPTRSKHTDNYHIYTHEESKPITHNHSAYEGKNYAKSERCCQSNHSVDYDRASTTNYTPGAWGAEWYYSDKVETLSATEEGSLRHRKRHHHKHSHSRAHSSNPSKREKLLPEI